MQLGSTGQAILLFRNATAGTGVGHAPSIVAVRFNCPAEITPHRLHRAALPELG
jgi:hypothetical protein